MRPIKLIAIALVALTALAGSGAALIAVGYQQGYEPQAYADPVPAVGPAGAALFDAANPPPAVAPARPEPSLPCIDRDGAGPAPCIAVPLDEPRAYVDTAASAKHIGWPLLVLVILFPVLTVAGRKVPWLSTGYRALIVSGLAAGCAAAANAGFSGGSWYAMLTAAGGALLLAWQGDRTLAAHATAMRDAGAKAGV